MLTSGGRKFLRVSKRERKHYIDLTEAEREKVARCKGQKDNHVCKNPLFHCGKCGNYGCDQDENNKCTEQAFKQGKCLYCGSTNTMGIVMKKDLEKLKEEWDKDFVPEVDEVLR